jgi:predicted transcriptional regulator of viral defense system
MEYGNNTRTLITRFFAYVQLKKLERIATGELLQSLNLTPGQEKHLLSRLAKSGWIVRLRRGLYLIPPRIPEGPWNPGIYLTLQKLMEDCDGMNSELSKLSPQRMTEMIKPTHN